MKQTQDLRHRRRQRPNNNNNYNYNNASKTSNIHQHPRGVNLANKFFLSTNKHDHFMKEKHFSKIIKWSSLFGYKIELVHSKDFNNDNFGNDCGYDVAKYSKYFESKTKRKSLLWSRSSFRKIKHRKK